MMKRSCDQCMHCRYIAKDDFGHYCYKHRVKMTAPEVETLGCDDFWPRAIIGKPSCGSCRFARFPLHGTDYIVCTGCFSDEELSIYPDWYCDSWRISDEFERTGKRLEPPKE